MRSKGLVLPLLILVAINVLNFYDRHVAGALAVPRPTISLDTDLR
jgi:hypothetical protein